MALAPLGDGRNDVVTAGCASLLIRQPVLRGSAAYLRTTGSAGFIDGGSSIAPRGGFFTRDGRWALEKDGTTPDIDVENWPKETISGRDAQLERAVQEAMRLLKERPVDWTSKKPPTPLWGKRRGPN